MFGISNGKLFILIGATTTLIAPNGPSYHREDCRAIGYVQLARGQFDTIMQQMQARQKQVHKELQDTLVQIVAILHEIRSISFVNPGPMARRFVDNLDNASRSDGVMATLDKHTAKFMSLREVYHACTNPTS